MTDVKRLTDFIGFKNGKAVELSFDGSVPVFGSNGLIGTTKEALAMDAVVLGRVGAYCGAVHLAQGTFWPTDNTIVARPTGGHPLRYIYYLLKTTPLREYAGGAAQPLITQQILNVVKVRTHDPIQAEKVVEILSAYDDLIENNRRRIGLLEEAARLLYREWFVYFRFPGHEHVKITNGLPEGWQRKSASEAFEVNPTTPRNDDGTISYIPMAALSETGMTIDPGPIERRQASTSVRFRNGDTLLARITPCLENGKTGFVYSLDDGEVACGSTEFIVLRGRSVSNYFVYLTSREEKFRGNAIKSMIGASGRQRVQPDCLDRYFVAIPPKLIAEMFDEAVSKMFQQIATLDKQSYRLATARDLLLPRLMSGEIAV